MSHVDDEAALRSNYRQPTSSVLRKAVDHVDAGAAGFIAASPLVIVATASDAGADASPRGGPPGFVRVLDEHRVAFGDLSGNNRLDTYSNLVAQPAVGMLFIVPGLEETLRLNGRASVTTDASVLAATAVDGRLPKVAVVVAVEECYLHCGKALRRAGIWDQTSWLPAGELPSPAAIITRHLGLDVSPEVVAADLEANYVETLWERGGA